MQKKFNNQSQLNVCVWMCRMNLCLVKELGDRAAQGRAYGNLGNTHYLLGNFVEAIKFHRQVRNPHVIHKYQDCTAVMQRWEVSAIMMFSSLDHSLCSCSATVVSHHIIHVWYIHIMFGWIMLKFLGVLIDCKLSKETQ